MPPRTNQFLVGQRPTRTYRSRFSEWFFSQLDRGITSPYVLLTSGAFFSYLAYKITERFVAPRREQLAMRRPVQRVPLADSHNAFWGFSSDPTSPQVRQEEDATRNLYLPQGTNAEHEEVLRRPQLLTSEVSELHTRPTPENPSGEVDILCLELSEYDPSLQDDVYYRSVHYVPNITGESGASSSSVQPMVATPAEGKKNDGDGETSYLSFMPEQGQDVVHGMVKCKGVTAQNNCVPYAGHLEEEYARKLMLALGPVHILRDAAKTQFPLRFTYSKQVPVETLVLGLHSGELPRWLSTCYPNFHLDVVEPDGALIRICKRFFGFQESSNLTVTVSDPVDYVRQVGLTAAHEVSGGRNRTTKDAAKRYDLVLIDTMDGSGRLSTQYGRLDFVHHVRNAMNSNGCVAMTIPNKDAGFVYNVVQNWRMAFSGRPVVLVHCVTAPVSILLTFQDSAERGKSNVGSVANVEEFQDILRAHIRHYGVDRMQFDLTKEVEPSNFSVLNPERKYELSAYLPKGHPALSAEAERRKQEAVAKRVGGGVSGWLRRWTSGLLTPSQRADLSNDGKRTF